MEASIGNIKSIEVAYERTKEYIVYDSFPTVIIPYIFAVFILFEFIYK